MLSLSTHSQTMTAVAWALQKNPHYSNGIKTVQTKRDLRSVSKLSKYLL